jgi:hypothetical protein
MSQVSPPVKARNDFKLIYYDCMILYYPGELEGGIIIEQNNNPHFECSGISGSQYTSPTDDKSTTWTFSLLTASITESRKSSSRQYM